MPERLLPDQSAPTQCENSLMAVGDALYAIGGKWKLRIIIALSGARLRFNELQRAMPGLSARVLSNELKELELNGFVKRSVQTDPAILITYELTPYSHTLKNVISALHDWGLMHRATIRAQASQARER